MFFKKVLQLGLYDEFREMEGYSKYRISASGKIWSNYKNGFLSTERSNGKYRQTALYPDIDKTRNGDEWLVHKLVYEAFNLDPYGMFEPDHINHNPKDPRLCNLQPLTHSENQQKQCYYNKCIREGYELVEIWTPNGLEYFFAETAD